MGWDKGLDYGSTYARILKHMGKARYPSICYDAVLLIQLRNGARVSEAVRAFREFLTTKSVELDVRVSKRRDSARRLMVIPHELVSTSIDACKEMLGHDDDKLVNRVKTYVKEAYGFNTHSLRYAFITHLLKQGVSPAVISKITGHKNLNYILTYTQEKAAEQILKEGL